MKIEKKKKEKRGRLWGGSIYIRGRKKYVSFKGQLKNKVGSGAKKKKGAVIAIETHSTKN